MRNQLSDILSCISVLRLPLRNGRPLPFCEDARDEPDKASDGGFALSRNKLPKVGRKQELLLFLRKKEREKLKLNLCSRHESLFSGSGSAHLTFLLDSGSMLPGAGARNELIVTNKTPIKQKNKTWRELGDKCSHLLISPRGG